MYLNNFIHRISCPKTTGPQWIMLCSTAYCKTCKPHWRHTCTMFWNLAHERHNDVVWTDFLYCFLLCSHRPSSFALVREHWSHFRDDRPVVNPISTAADRSQDLVIVAQLAPRNAKRRTSTTTTTLAAVYRSTTSRLDGADLSSRPLSPRQPCPSVNGPSVSERSTSRLLNPPRPLLNFSAVDPRALRSIHAARIISPSVSSWRSHSDQPSTTVTFVASDSHAQPGFLLLTSNSTRRTNNRYRRGWRQEVRPTALRNGASWPCGPMTKLNFPLNPRRHIRRVWISISVVVMHACRTQCKQWVETAKWNWLACLSTT